LRRGLVLCEQLDDVALGIELDEATLQAIDDAVADVVVR